MEVILVSLLTGFSRSHTVYYAYILRSLKDGSYYYGSTEDRAKRLAEHNSGKERYTKGHVPYVLHYSESFATRKEAAEREQFWKTIGGYRWLRKAGIIRDTSTESSPSSRCEAAG